MSRRIGPFKSYRSLFRIKHVIYKVGNLRLWGFGVSFEQLLTGAVAFLLLWTLYAIFPLLNYIFLNKWVVITAGVFGAMWASARYELGGKSILMWAAGIILWAVRNKYSTRGRSMKKPSYKKHKIELNMVYKDMPVTDQGTLAAPTPCEIHYQNIEKLKITGTHKLIIKPNKNKIIIKPVSKQHKDCVNNEEMVYLKQNKTNVVHTPKGTTYIENINILSQPAPSPEETQKHKPQYGLAWYVETTE